MKKVLFIDRDGTLIKEPPIDFQVDSLEKLEFVPRAISAMGRIAKLDYHLAMVSNQDGLGTDSFPEETFHPAHNKMLSILEGEGVCFDSEHIDPSFESENSPNRKPRTGMLTSFMDGDYSMEESYVIGDRITDVMLAKNLGAKAILLQEEEKGRAMAQEADLLDICALVTDDWNKIYELLRLGRRHVEVARRSRETDISLTLDLDGAGSSAISTGLGFFDHMLDQIVHHAGVAMELKVVGDLQVDEHHTIEDSAIVLGEAVLKALGDKRGIERYGFALPMDECDAMVVIDFGGRIDFRWDVEFKREMIGDTPTEMFSHFFKSFADGARCNLHIKASGENEHHKIEGVFKAFARSLKAAFRRDAINCSLPSSKGLL